MWGHLAPRIWFASFTSLASSTSKSSDARRTAVHMCVCTWHFSSSSFLAFIPAIWVLQPHLPECHLNTFLPQDQNFSSLLPAVAESMWRDSALWIFFGQRRGVVSLQFSSWTVWWQIFNWARTLGSSLKWWQHFFWLKQLPLFCRESLDTSLR